MKIYYVDAFTSQPFSGNPAAVCILSENMPDAWMKNLAREINFSETAFLLPDKDGYRLRWFTPTQEEELCGHATLASAHTLWTYCDVSHFAELHFYTRSGLLTAKKAEDWITLDFPAEIVHPVDIPPLLLQGLNVVPDFVGRNRLDFLVQIQSEEILRNLAPDFSILKKLPARGVIVTSVSSNPSYDFVSRFFAPHDGVDEDPVTGSAHCALGPFWGDRLAKQSFTAYQASERGGVVKLSLHGKRVYLSGQAVSTMITELIV